MRRGTLYMPEGKTIAVDVPDLAMARTLIGGYLEVLRLECGEVLLVDEDGLPKNLPVNSAATQVYMARGAKPVRAVDFSGLRGKAIRCPTSVLG